MIGINDVCIDADHVWVGTSIGLFWVDRRTGDWSPARLPPGMPTYTNLEADDIHADATSGIWVSDSHGMVRIAR